MNRLTHRPTQRSSQERGSLVHTVTAIGRCATVELWLSSPPSDHRPAKPFHLVLSRVRLALDLSPFPFGPHPSGHEHRPSLRLLVEPVVVLHAVCWLACRR